MATYNGEKYLRQQLDSILQQKYPYIEVIVIDDASTDGTLSILNEYAKLDDRIHLYRNEKNLGVIATFDRGLELAKGEFIAFSDQDDVWDVNKIQILQSRMQILEESIGSSTPILVHSDLVVVNWDLQELHPSFWRYAGLDAKRHELAQLLISNIVTGCALIANRALVESARPIPVEAVMHDHWFALVAAALGHIEPVYEPLVSYRQHGNNAVGAQFYGWLTIFKKLLSGCGRIEISQLRHQAGILNRRYSNCVDSNIAELIDGFSNLQNKGWLARRLFMLRHGILRPGVVRNLGLFFCVRFTKNGGEKSHV